MKLLRIAFHEKLKKISGKYLPLTLIDNFFYHKNLCGSFQLKMRYTNIIIKNIKYKISFIKIVFRISIHK